MKRFRPFLLLIFVSLLSACSFSLAEDVTPPPGAQQSTSSQPQPAQVSGPLYPLVPPNPDNGRAIYAEKCTPCHGQTGMGDGPQAAQLPNPVAAIGSPDVARQSTPAQWYTQVTQGNLDRFMPPFNSLSDSERWDVVAYAFSLSAPASDVAQGAELFQASCARCHGEQGQGDGPEAANFSTKLSSFTDQAFMSQKTSADFYKAMTEGVSPDMPAFADQLSDAQRWMIADYLRTLTFAAAQQPSAAAVPPSAEGTPGGTPAPQAEATLEATSPLTSTEVVSATAAVGSVTGQVTNASGGNLPQDMIVTLHGFDNMTAVITDTASLKADGSFAFDNIDMPAGRVFMATVDYDQTTYGSDIAVVQDGQTSIELPIPIYETTTDPSILKVDRLHLFFEFVDSQTLRVIELYVISNPTDKTLVPATDGATTVDFTLPQGATNLEFQDGQLGDRYLQTPNGFGDTIPVRPGSANYQVLYAFEMPYDRKLDLVQPVSLPIDAVVILVPEGGIKIKSDMLQDAGVQDVQGTQYHMYNGTALNPGDKMSLTITGGPATAGLSLAAGSKDSLLVGLGVFGVALIVAGVWLFRRTRRSYEYDEDEALDIEEDELVATENVDTLMDAILTLDDLYQAGQLPEEAYLKRRADLKARLKELMG